MRRSNLNFERIELKNSPIEFVLIGPVEGRDTIIVKSDKAGLDLIGLANNYRSKRELPNYNSILNIFYSKSDRQLNIVESMRSFDMKYEADDRLSKYRFAWVGYGFTRSNYVIQSILDEIVTSVTIVVDFNDTEAVETLLSRIVLECSLINQRRIKAKKSTMVILLFYGLFFILLVIYLFMYKGFFGKFN